MTGRSDAWRVIEKLPPIIRANGWLGRHHEAALGWEAELTALGRWLAANSTPKQLLSRRERSLEVFGNGKALLE